ncbi:MAG: mevalonate kinase [Candidatus Micrarchaeota archaeon]|nr:mevalonate kinase [Candidatus Micrarchaeota archaeon]
MRSFTPCKVILFGEHAVPYDKRGVAAAIGEGTYIDAHRKGEGLGILMPFEPKSVSISKTDLFEKLAEFRKNYETKNFEALKSMSFVDSIQVVAGETMQRLGFENLEISVDFKEGIKGIGRSASIYSGIVTAIYAELGSSLTKNEVNEIAYLGDVIAHGGMPSGIDTSTVTFGGYLSYKKSEGPRPLTIDYTIPLLVVDSGEPSRTKDAVSFVKELRNKEPKRINEILDNIDLLSEEAITLLRKSDLQGIGTLAKENNSLLRALGVSTPRLDEIIQIANGNGALGAKITGAGMGGCAIVISSDSSESEKLKKRFLDKGFRAILTTLGVEGSRIIE